MKVLIVGSGGREHAIAWKLKQSKKVSRIFCAPGNGGMSLISRCVNIKPENIRGLADFAQRNKINLTIVGPEVPLALGIVDEFQRRKLRIFGPDKNGAQIESSKIFSKQFMQKYHIPTAPFRVFSTSAEAIGFCKSVEFPVVIKTDGLAAGKGVIIVKNFDDAVKTIDDIMEKKIFGKAGAKILIESFMRGQEVSVMAITDGKTIIPLLSSQDHKQALEGDKGPNTGGMGAYCPTNLIDDQLMEDLFDHILNPTINSLRNEKIIYQGILYVGLMLTETGPKVLEYNCRFGDPETQAVLPLLKTDLWEMFNRVVDKSLGGIGKLEWRRGNAACVVMTSQGYPGKYRTGKRIHGIQKNWNHNSFVLHAGTKRNGTQWLTNGGRVLGVVGIDRDLQSALSRAYQLVNKIDYEGATYRKDIGFRALKQKTE